MAISLVKGQSQSIASKLSSILLGLGWDVNETEGGVDFDLDASAFLLDSKKKLISESHFVFFNNLTSPDPYQSVEHLGDNPSGAGDGDDEVIKVNLKRVPTQIQHILFTVTIHDAETRNQNFGQVKNAFVRLINEDTEEEVLRYDLTESFPQETAIVMAELYRDSDGWHMKAIGAGYKGGMEGLLQVYKPQPAMNWRFRVLREQVN